MKNIALGLGVALVVVLGILAYMKFQDSSELLPEPPLEPAPLTDNPPEELAPQGGTPEENEYADATGPATEPEPPPLPADPGEADEYLRETFTQADPQLGDVLAYDHLIDKLVGGANLVYREKNPLRKLPFLKSGDRLMVKQGPRGLELSPRNYQRYAKWVDMLENLDTPTLASTYRFLQPLFNDAYDQLGIPGESWNTVLEGAFRKVVEIDVSREAPLLAQAGKVYIYADPEVESLSHTHKAFIRMGRDNTTRIQAKLREIYEAIR